MNAFNIFLHKSENVDDVVILTLHKNFIKLLTWPDLNVVILVKTKFDFI